nr:formate--tetrahydrofolate ligase [Streptococcus anginosus]
FTYPDHASLAEKITAVARRVYGGASVTFAQEAREQLRDLEERGYGRYPVCIAKTPASFTTDPVWRDGCAGVLDAVVERKRATC